MKRFMVLSLLWLALGFAIGCLWSNWYWQGKFVALENRVCTVVDKALDCRQLGPDGVTVTIDGKRQ
jgi:hypothetical protein